MALFGLIITGKKKAANEHGRENLLPEKTANPLPADIPAEEHPHQSGKSADSTPKTKDTKVKQRHSQKDTVVPFVHTPPKDNLLACRYELKYRISESKAQAIKTYVQNFLPVDRYALIYPDRQYPISSLYLDSENLDLCRETLLGKTNRFKLRIRAYDDQPQSPVFFEIKRRADKVILKSRARVNRTGMAAVLEGSGTFQGSKKDQETLQQFLYYRQMIQGRPVVMVRYMREPFEGNTDSRVRVTFDRHLCYQQVSKPQVVLNGDGWHCIPIPFVILEIKFTEHYPAWLNRLVQMFNLDRSSMSKYVTSVKQSKQIGFQKAFPYYLE